MLSIQQERVQMRNNPTATQCRYCLYNLSFICIYVYFVKQVKILYVRNLMLSTTEDSIREAFVKAGGKDGCVERVKKLRDYAFVHFREREDAQSALELMNGVYSTHLDLINRLRYEGWERTGIILEHEELFQCGSHF